MEVTRSRGIYLVANDKSSAQCHNLIFTIRECGSTLPIRVIHYGGKPLQLHTAFPDVRTVTDADFPSEGQAFVAELSRRLPQCSPGLLMRFYAWFGEFDEFLYSDNDIVALMNWDDLFQHLADYDLVNADNEFSTYGKYNMEQPERFEEIFGKGALEYAITAGHFLCSRKPNHRADILKALSWMEAHPEIPKWHDQALLLVTLVQSKWPTLNLCKPPHNWASSWAGHYADNFDVIRTIQARHQPISHLHYSGGVQTGLKPIDDLMNASLPLEERNKQLLGALLSEAMGVATLKRFIKRAKNKIKRSRMKRT